MAIGELVHEFRRLISDHHEVELDPLDPPERVAESTQELADWYAEFREWYRPEGPHIGEPPQGTS